MIKRAESIHLISFVNGCPIQALGQKVNAESREAALGYDANFHA